MTGRRISLYITNDIWDEMVNQFGKTDISKNVRKILINYLNEVKKSNLQDNIKHLGWNGGRKK